tara:strand:+ start:127 stop:513 length:387 start_codon:yes stop_codon:yes gene_type:complete
MSGSQSIKMNKDYSATKEELESYNKIKADEIRASMDEAAGNNWAGNDGLSNAVTEGDRLTRLERERMKGLNMTSPQANTPAQKLNIISEGPLNATNNSNATNATANATANASANATANATAPAVLEKK